MSYPTCHHVRANGAYCKSPALTNHLYCYYHIEERIRTRLRLRAQRLKEPFDLSIVEDPQSVAVAVNEVLQAIAARQIDSKMAGQLLYGLQIAALVLRTAHFEIGNCAGERPTEMNFEEGKVLDQEIELDIEQEKREAAEKEAAAAAASAPQPPAEPAPLATSAPAEEAGDQLPQKKPAHREREIAVPNTSPGGATGS